MSLTRTHMNLSKNQFYGGDGTGRDTYIYNNNGGFCPDKPSLKVEQLGKFNHDLSSGRLFKTVFIWF